MTVPVRLVAGRELLPITRPVNWDDTATSSPDDYVSIVGFFFFTQTGGT